MTSADLYDAIYARMVAHCHSLRGADWMTANDIRISDEYIMRMGRVLGILLTRMGRK